MTTRAGTSIYIHSVGQLLTYLRELMETDAYLADVWVSGEVANHSRSQAGHVYFTLRDRVGGMRCVLFARQAAMVRTALDDGAHVMVHGRVAIYEARGELQLIADFVRPEGVGVEQARFEQLVAKLEAEGLFDTARKRALPRFPRRIGVVTSPHGAVLHDICQVIERRWPLAELVLAATPVQGEAALAEIPEALRRLGADPSIDVVIVARGGGAAEELAVFNDEAIARALYACPHPVISAIGHETDTTIADLVADLRAPTPSAAAELVAPDRRDMLAAIERAALSLTTGVAGLAAHRGAEIEMRAQRLSQALPSVTTLRAAIDTHEGALRRTLTTRLAQTTASVGAAEARLAALSPLATLARGYAIVQRERDGALVRAAAEAPAGEALGIRLAAGTLRAEVTP